MTTKVPDSFVNEQTVFFRRRVGWMDISANVYLYQNGTVAATVNYARAYVDDGKATVMVRLTATAAGAAGNNIYIVLPPFLTPISGFTTGMPLGVATFIDAPTALYPGNAVYVANVSGNPTIACQYTTDGNVAGANPSFAIAIGDVFGANVTYEVG